MNPAHGRRRERLRAAVGAALAVGAAVPEKLGVEGRKALAAQLLHRQSAKRRPDDVVLTWLA